MTDVSHYEVRITDYRGNTVAILDEFTNLEYARKVNEIGELSLVIEDKYSDYIITPENRIEVWRTVNDVTKLDMGATWFIDSVISKIDGNGRFLEVNAKDQICLLDRRVIPYNEGNPTTDKQAEGDDVIKAIMRENFGALATDTDRDLSEYLTIQVDTTLAPQATVHCAKDNVLDIITDIADACYNSGTFLAFDIIYNPNTGLFRFETFINQRGEDMSIATGNGRTVVGIEYGSVSEIVFYDERTDEKNFVYCGKNMVVDIYSQKEASDTQSIALSPFNRKEIFESGSDADDEDELQTLADALLIQHRAHTRAEAKLSQDFALKAYGNTINYGDKITLSFDGRMYTVFVDAISVKISKDKEEIDIVLVDVNE